MLSNKQLHKNWRLSFRQNVFSRDKYKCVFCEKTSSLDAHHITDRHEMPNGGYVLENGITLCNEHHLKAEIYHSSNKKTGYKGMYPEDLYKKINSSYSVALNKSKELNS